MLLSKINRVLSTTKNYLTPNVSNVKVKNPCSRAVVFEVWFPRPLTIASPGRWLETPNLRSQPRPTKLQTLDVGPSNQCFNELPMMPIKCRDKVTYPKSPTLNMKQR